MAILIVIPARASSTRFPNKPLAKISNIAMVERVWQIAKAVSSTNDVVISTDDVNIQNHANSIGAKVVITGECFNGTDRVAQTLKKLPTSYDIIVNLQGDAVLTPPWVIEEVINAMLSDPKIELATPMVKLTGQKATDFIKSKNQGNSTGTAVVFDKNYNAMYFSKTIIPHYRENIDNKMIYKHIGLYAYKKATLLKFNALPPSCFEKIEHLEQLRALENNIPIKMVEVDYKGRTHGSVDNPEDIAIVENIIKKEGELILK